MGMKKEQIVGYWIAGILFVVGVVCYAALPDQAPEQPVRVMFKGTGGNVLFDHKKHVSVDGYAIECMDCHHDLEEPGDKPAACGECHDPVDEDTVKRSDALHTQCIGCHQDSGGGPEKCAECHRL
jgi:hypothetical protein